MSGRWKNLNDFLLDSMMSFQDLTSPHQDPGWNPKGQPKGRKAKRLTCRKTLETFYWILWGLIRTSLFPPGSRMRCQETAKATKRKISNKQKHLHDFLLNSMMSCQYLTFSHQDPGWDPKGQQNGQKWKCLTGRKTLAVFYWILWGRNRTSLFPPGSRMGPQGATKGTKWKMSGK